MNLHVLTWNLWWRFGDWRGRSKAIGRILSSERPDVCCLQEVWTDSNTSLAQVLAEDLKLHCAFFPAVDPVIYRRRSKDADVGIGNAILSRWPVVRKESQALTSGECEDEGRLIGFAEIDTPGGLLPVFTTHLNSGITDSAIRVLQVAQIADFMCRCASAEIPAILAGDFNCEPDADEIRIITGRSKPPRSGFGLRDAWRLTRDDTGATWSRRNPHVAKTPQLPDSRIDYVFLGYPQGGRDLSIQSCATVGTEPVEGVWASDHFGVSVKGTIV
ncbi:MAG TPA: endonuclease/exonuclease/phosphatase family protein [Bryobacteraceae bacterium]|nr:endonuclease/exonuclease/phosphatase family protein [Bryobacteraceae bacterium]